MIEPDIDDDDDDWYDEDNYDPDLTNCSTIRYRNQCNAQDCCVWEPYNQAEAWECPTASDGSGPCCFNDYTNPNCG